MTKAYCKTCSPHTNEDHSMYEKRCLLDGCPCKEYDRGEALPDLRPAGGRRWRTKWQDLPPEN